MYIYIYYIKYAEHDFMNRIPDISEDINHDGKTANKWWLKPPKKGQYVET